MIDGHVKWFGNVAGKAWGSAQERLEAVGGREVPPEPSRSLTGERSDS